MKSDARLKKWMMCIGLSGLATGVALGWSIPTAFSAERPKDDLWLNRAKADYNLRPDQVRIIRAVLIQKELDITSIKTSIPNDRLDDMHRRRVEAARRKADDRILVVLDEDQREQYSKHLKDRDSLRFSGKPRK